MGFLSKIFGKSEDDEVQEIYEISEDGYQEDAVEEVYDNIEECCSCGIKIPDDEGENIYGNFYCSDCLDDKCFKCEKCGEYNLRSEVNYIDDEPYCDCCSEDIRNEDIPDYDYNGNSDKWRE